MRSSFLAACGLVLSFLPAANAQITLTSGATTQNFDTLGAGLPAGWSVYTNASVNSFGTPATLTTSPTAWNVATTGTDFRNIASNNVATNASAATQSADANRAFGWRPLGSTSAEVTPGRTGALMATFANTSGLVVTALSVNVFTANDVSGSQTYQLEYRVGDLGDFNPIGTAYTTNTPFSADTLSADAATLAALSNRAGPIYVRLRGTSTSGASSLDTLGVDDFTIVCKTAQTLSFAALPTRTFGEVFTLTATASSGLAPTFTVVSGPASISGNTATITGTGTVTIRTSQPGDATYAAAPEVDRSFTATKASQTTSFAALPARTYGDPAFTVAATASSGLPVTFSIVSGPATIAGSTITLTGGGNVTVRAAQTGNANYLAAPNVDQTFTVNKVDQTLVFAAIPAKTLGDAPFTLSATATPSGLSATFAVVSGPATVSGSTLTLTGAGDVTVRASQPGSATFNPAPPVEQTFSVAKGAQTIAFAALPDRPAATATFALNATASSGLPVSYSVVAGAASVAGNSLTIAGTTGSVTVRASQPGDSNYNAAADVDRTFGVTDVLRAPTVRISPVNVTAYVGDPLTLTGIVDGLPAPTLQWRFNDTPIAGATNASLSFLAVTRDQMGRYDLIATNSVGTASALTVVFIVKRQQTIAFELPAGAAPAGAALTLNATASSGLPVSYELVSGTGSLVNNVLTGTNGNVTVRATQPGNDYYDPAPVVDQTINFVAGALSPFLTTKPADQVVTAGKDVTFRGAALGNPAPTYQWQKDGAALAGATNATLSLPTVSPADSGRYTVVATNLSGSTSASALLTVRAPPVIVTEPASQTVYAGTETRFAVEVTGVPAPTLQWRKNGSPIAGATDAMLVIASPLARDAGRYDLVATNVLGTATSATATLTVNTRAFAGTYFGSFRPANGTASAGDFALVVREDRSAVFLGFLPGSQTGMAALAGTIDLSGNFSLVADTLSPALVSVEQIPATAAATQPVTLRGAIDDAAGTVSGTVSELGVTLDGARAGATGPAADDAGFYQAALVGSSSGRGYLILAADGQAMFMTAAGAAMDAGRGNVDASGRLRVTTATQASLELAFANGAVKGTVRTPTGVSGVVSGAREELAGTEHVVNLSVRSVTTPTAPLITGFVIGGAGDKQVLIRAAGPALAQAPFNIAGALGDPTLQVFRGNTTIAQNDDWGTPAANRTAVSAATTRAGAFPFRNGSADAALVSTLHPGSYTVMIGGGTGTVLAEIYEVPGPNDTSTEQRLVNVSARGVATPTTPVIAGFVIAGTAPQRVLIRGIGPTLAGAPFRVAGTLPNPQLTLFRGTTALKTSDDWFRDPEAALIRSVSAQVGAFALGNNSSDAAMLLYLEPGAYTAQVSAPPNASPANSTGIALIEIYDATP